MLSTMLETQYAINSKYSNEALWFITIILKQLANI